MLFPYSALKGNVTADADPNATPPAAARLIPLKAYFDGSQIAPTASVLAFFDVLTAAGVVCTDGALTAQLWIKVVGDGQPWIKVGAAIAVAAGNGRLLSAFKFPGLNQPTNAFLQLTGIAGAAPAAAADVRVNATAGTTVT